MKTKFFSGFLTILVLFGVFLIPGSGYSQRASSKNNDIALDVVDGFINNTFSIQYEFKSTSTSSFAVRGQFVTAVLGSSAFGVGGEWRFYILDSRALAGFNVGPAVDLYFFKNNDLAKSNIVFSVGGDAAYKWFFDQFTVEPSLGVRLGFTGSDVIPGVTPFTVAHLIGAVYLGWAW
jgi:hypothetical protein